MKLRTFTLISSAFIALMSAGLQTVSAFDTTGCNQVFAPRPLRYGYAYHFYDDYKNLDTYKHQVT